MKYNLSYNGDIERRRKVSKRFELEIKESAEKLRKMYKQEKRARIRERVQMLYLYRSKVARERQELSKILGSVDINF